MRRATSSLRSRVSAMPFSSMVMATVQAPYCLSSGNILSIFSQPRSRWTELTMPMPGSHSSACATTSGSVESMQSGASICPESVRTTRVMVSCSSARSVRATQTSRACAPPSTCSRATARIPEMSFASKSSFIFLLPCELTRSPMSSGRGSWCSATALRPLESMGTRRGGLRAGCDLPTASTTWRRCSGVVPQQPPTTERRKSRTKRARYSASSPGWSG